MYLPLKVIAFFLPVSHPMTGFHNQLVASWVPKISLRTEEGTGDTEAGGLQARGLPGLCDLARQQNI